MNVSITTVIKHIVMVLGVFISFFIGDDTGLIYALLIAMIIDYITGVLNAAFAHSISSEIGAKGIVKKITILMLVGLGNLIDAYLLKEGSAVRTMIIFFYLANEGISILENAVSLGLPVPRKLWGILEKIQEEDHDKNNECDI